MINNGITNVIILPFLLIDIIKYKRHTISNKKPVRAIMDVNMENTMT